MAVTAIERNIMDRSEWDAILATSTVKDVFQTYDWADLTRTLYHYEPHFLVVSEDGITLGGQLFFGKKVFWVGRAYEAFGGPLFREGRGEDVLSALIAHLQRMRRPLLIYEAVRPQCPHDFERLFTESGFSADPFQTFLVDLKRPVDEIWTSFIQNARWGVRKGEKAGVIVSEATSWDQWELFHSMHVQHSKAHGIAPKSPEFMKYVHENLCPKNLAKLFVATREGNIVAGMLFLICQDTMVYYIGASDAGSLSLSPNDPIMWHAIKWGKENGVLVLNLEDTYPNPKSNLYGIHKFKEKWGGQLTRRDFYIRGRFYMLGRSLVLNNRAFQRGYAALHKRNII